MWNGRGFMFWGVYSMNLGDRFSDIKCGINQNFEGNPYLKCQTHLDLWILAVSDIFDWLWFPKAITYDRRIWNTWLDAVHTSVCAQELVSQERRGIQAHILSSTDVYVGILIIILDSSAAPELTLLQKNTYFQEKFRAIKNLLRSKLVLVLLKPR